MSYRWQKEKAGVSLEASFRVEGRGEGDAVVQTAEAVWLFFNVKLHLPRGAMRPSNARSTDSPAHLKTVSTVMAPPMTLPGRVSRMAMREGFISGVLGSGRGGERCVMLKLWMKICAGSTSGDEADACHPYKPLAAIIMTCGARSCPGGFGRPKAARWAAAAARAQLRWCHWHVSRHVRRQRAA